MAQYVRLSSQGQTTTPTFSTCGFLQSVDGIDQSSVSGQGSEGMNDHQDSENFAYDKSWDNILRMLDKAEKEQNRHFMLMQRTKNKKKRIEHMRNYKALEGVVAALRWTLGDLRITERIVLGLN